MRIPGYRATNRPFSVWRGATVAAILSGAMIRASSVTPLTCLIVDDSPPFCRAARQLLAHDGVTVIACAATSDQAIEKTLAVTPAVALVDVALGIESGLDVARRLAALPHGGPPVVLISAESGSELAELVDASGALGFVSKTDLSGDAIRRLLASADSEG